MAAMFGRWFETVSGLAMHATIGWDELLWIASLGASAPVLAMLPAVIVYRMPLEKALRSQM